MKKTVVLLTAFLISTNLVAHCGSCGTGDKVKKSCKSCTKKMDRPAHHAKEWHDKTISKLNLSSAQQRQYDKLRTQYAESLTKLRNEYLDDVEKVLTKKQFRQFIKKEEKLLYVSFDN